MVVIERDQLTDIVGWCAMYETNLMPIYEWDLMVRSPKTKNAEGYLCAKHNLPRADNPHPVGSTNYEAWAAGWDRYETERIERVAKEKNADR